jgi:hypothetical protein
MECLDKFRSEQMLTVESLIKWLQTQDPKACILGFETNSNAYTEQFRELPNQSMCTVKDAKEDERKWLYNFYRGTDPKKEGFDTLEELVEAKVAEVFRYAHDNDITVNF